jgi:hypothetical protein
MFTMNKVLNAHYGARAGSSSTGDAYVSESEEDDEEAAGRVVEEEAAGDA